MGLMDTLTSKLGNQSESSDQKSGSLLSGVMEMFSSGESGGIQGLINSFQQKGLGDIVSSWVSRGENRSISPDQLKEGLGSDKVRDLAAKSGMSEDEAATQLSRYLPDFVDKITPDGTIPEGGWLDKGMDFLKGTFR